ncbi:MAG: hypothetical protein U9N50_00980 [Pseudomonadota bacterium]|nr:hypothetical protein [Pseudomonadota bacterium]
MKNKTPVRSLLISTLLAVAAPSYAGSAMQMWKCEMDDDATEQGIKEYASKWLAAAKKLNGGEGLQAYVNFPVAVNDMGETDLTFVVIAPNFEAWGKFWDAYGDSELAVMDDKNDDVICPDSAVWESFPVK